MADTIVKGITLDMHTLGLDINPGVNYWQTRFDDAFGPAQGTVPATGANNSGSMTGNVAAVAGAATPSDNGAAQDWLSHLFIRGVVIITGFIFVAVGLSMFKNNSQ